MATPSHDSAVKAAVLAALLAGQSVSQVAKEYRLPKGTVSSWRKRTLPKLVSVGATTDATVAPSATQKSEPIGPTIGDLLLELVRENLKGLLAGARLLQDKEWTKKQGAAELGTILGITHDKTVRMLEAMDRAAEPASPEPPAAA